MSRRLLRKGKNMEDKRMSTWALMRFSGENFYDGCMIRYGYLIYDYTHQQMIAVQFHTAIRQSRPKKAVVVDSTNSMHHLSLPSTLLALALPLLSQYALPTLANTEIINFEAGKPIPVAPLSENW